VVVAADRSAEKSHHLIADQLVERAVVAEDGARRQLVEPIQLGRDLGRRELLGEGSETTDVGKQDRDVARLPARGSQLVSERAEVGILA
jgi:hypothetical protein